MNTSEKDFPFIKGVDSRSGLEEHAFSFFLKYYIPAEGISDLQDKSFFDSMNKTLEEYVNEDLKDQQHLVADAIGSGSAAEGLLLPVFLDRKSGEKVFHSDFDILRILPGIVAFEGHYLGPGICFPMVPASHPGFVKLLDPYGGQDVNYLNNQDALKIVQQSSLKHPQPGLNMNPHGPAVTTDSPKLPIEIDNVYAIRCSSWPKTASGWETRERRWGWPTASLIKSIVSKGCLLVPVGHKLSSEPQYEWRLSFSVAEKVLAQSLTSFQKKAYILLKILHREYLSSPKIIATYHLKTILFWMCERRPESFWADSNMARCLFALLDELTACLSSHNLPNFFVPDNNMISHVPSDLVQTVLNKIEVIRRDPLHAILDFDQKFRLICGPRLPWNSSIMMFMKSVKMAKSDCEIIANFEFAMIDLSNLMVSQSGDVEWGVEKAFYFLKEAWGYRNLINQGNKKVSFMQYATFQLNAMFNHMSCHPTLATMQRLSNMISHCVANNEMNTSDVSYLSQLHSLIATLNHAISKLTAEFDGHGQPSFSMLTDAKREEAKMKSENHHKRAMELSPDNFGIKTEYAKLLFHNSAFKEVIDLIEPLVELPLDTVIKEKTQITRAELPTLEIKLQNFVKLCLSFQEGSLILPNIVIALYYLLLAQVKVGCDKETVCNLMKHLKQSCEHKANRNSRLLCQFYKTIEEMLGNEK